MTRRSSPQARLDERAFPVRVRIAVPEEGFGKRLNQMYDWLSREAGRGNHASHGAGHGIMDAMAVYFRDVETAAAFIRAFPDLELADWTEFDWYTSPSGRAGSGPR
jgi:hypothetical protein